MTFPFALIVVGLTNLDQFGLKLAQLFVLVALIWSRTRPTAVIHGRIPRRGLFAQFHQLASPIITWSGSPIIISWSDLPWVQSQHVSHVRHVPLLLSQPLPGLHALHGLYALHGLHLLHVLAPPHHSHRSLPSRPPWGVQFWLWGLLSTSFQPWNPFCPHFWNCPRHLFLKACSVKLKSIGLYV